MSPDHLVLFRSLAIRNLDLKTRLNILNLETVDLSKKKRKKKKFTIFALISQFDCVAKEDVRFLVRPVYAASACNVDRGRYVAVLVRSGVSLC